jgi:transcriptional regulator with XRE-family HTH domain
MEYGFDLEKSLRILKSKRITKEKVAEQTGVSPGYISKMLSGAKPLSQSYIDVFLKEYASELEGEVLIESSDKKTMISIIALEAQVEALTKLSLALIKILVKTTGKTLDDLIEEKPSKEMLNTFNDFVEGEAKRLLKK